jgi:Tol biopolymer transport system component
MSPPIEAIEEDGRSIAFLRQSNGSSAYYLVPALGGPERKLADVFTYQGPSSGNSPYYSPDGKYLAIPDKVVPAEPMSIYLLSSDNGVKRKLTSPPAGIGDHYPAFSPDGKRLAFVRITHWSANDLYVSELSGGEPRRLTFDKLQISGLAWTSDSREIVFASRRIGSTIHLWRISADGGMPEQVETVGRDLLSPAFSPKGMGSGKALTKRKPRSGELWNLCNLGLAATRTGCFGAASRRCRLTLQTAPVCSQLGKNDLATTLLFRVQRLTPHQPTFPYF